MNWHKSNSKQMNVERSLKTVYNRVHRIVFISGRIIEKEQESR
jgi:hypothetical protein